MSWEEGQGQSGWERGQERVMEGEPGQSVLYTCMNRS